MSNEDTPRLALLLEKCQKETEAKMAADAEARKLAEAMFGRLIANKVDDLRLASRAAVALENLIEDMGRIERRDLAGKTGEA